MILPLLILYMFSFFKKICKYFNLTRLIITNLIFLVFIFFIISLFLSKEKIEISDPSILVLNLDGQLIEHKKNISTAALIEKSLSNETGQKEILISDIKKAIDLAKTDKRIKAIYLDTQGLEKSSLSNLKYIAKTMRSFQDSGKKIYTFSSWYTQEQYFLASFSNEIYLHPKGLVSLSGYARENIYFKNLLDKLDLQVNIFKKGDYKSAPEQFTKTKMSEFAKEQTATFLNQRWQLYLDTISSNRNISQNNINLSFLGLKKQLAKNDFSLDILAQDLGLVDDILTGSEFSQKLITEVGKSKNNTFNNIVFQDYLKSFPLKNQKNNKNKVAIIHLDGAIVFGSGNDNLAYSDDVIASLQKARFDKNIKAIVLRVNSPGGSAFASELIAYEIEELKKINKPVIVSMGQYAASGGYWISSFADKIIAHESTITGSIGVFAINTNLGGAVKKLGITTDKIATTQIAQMSIFSPLDLRAKELFNLMINKTYDDFLTLIVKNRKIPLAQVRDIANGKVYTGQDAQKLNLVDIIGDLDKAVEIAADSANLKDYDSFIIEKNIGFKNKIIQDFLGTSIEILALNNILPNGVLDIFNKSSAKIDLFFNNKDPLGIYSYCLPCE